MRHTTVTLQIAYHCCNAYSLNPEGMLDGSAL